MTNSELILKTIRLVVEKQLAPARVLDISVHEDVDHEGDEILKVEVTFEVEGERLNPESVLSLARHLREPLENVKEDRFPVFTFLTPGEMDGAAA